MLADQLQVARDCGLRMALVAPMLVGLPVFAELRRESGLALLAHPAFGGATRIAPALLLGKLFRLFGADATIFPNHGGRFSYGRDTCLAIARAARDPWEGFAPTLPVPAGRHERRARAGDGGRLRKRYDAAHRGRVADAREMRCRSEAASS